MTRDPRQRPEPAVGDRGRTPTSTGAMASPESPPDAPVFSTSYRLTVELARRVLRRWTWHAHGGYVVAWLVALASAALALGSLPWLSGFFAGLATAAAFLHLSSRAATLRQIAALQNEPIELRLDSDGVHLGSRHGSVHAPWTDLTRVDRLREAWILRRGRLGGPVILPTGPLEGVGEASLRDAVARHRILLDDASGTHAPQERRP